MRDAATAQLAVEMGADAVGVVLVPGSPRFVTLSDAKTVADAVRGRAASVALFVNADARAVEAACLTINPDVLQFHGDESEAFCAQFARPYWKAIRVSVDTDLLESNVQFRSATRLLLDAYVATADASKYGGTGHRFDWGVIPRSMRKEIMLSGGLSPDNVALAIRDVAPWGVDVSSGVESARGVKSHTLIQNFINRVREEEQRA